MLNLSNKLFFAVEAVVDIAFNAGGQPVQSRDITQRQNIPQRYLEQVLQQLVRAGVLTGVRGPRGGYILARERRRITVGDITRVISGLEEEDNSTPASDLGSRVMEPMWQEMQEKFLKDLDQVSIEDLCLKANKENIESEAHRRLDFTI
ncbi:MAG: Rrf2 family transcriptional regulator [Alphaproteobacteria bacterium]